MVLIPRLGNVDNGIRARGINGPCNREDKRNENKEFKKFFHITSFPTECRMIRQFMTYPLTPSSQGYCSSGGFDQSNPMRFSRCYPQALHQHLFVKTI